MYKNLREKIYNMSNSFLPLDMFYNDIENMSKYPSFNKEYAFKDLEKIADFVLDLQSQLTEKNKEKENFKVMYFNKCLDYEHLYEKLDDKCSEFELKEYDYKQTIFEKNQDKISFAVEKLVSVQKYISDNAVYVEEERFAREINDFIDNQINELKEADKNLF